MPPDIGFIVSSLGAVLLYSLLLALPIFSFSPSVPLLLLLQAVITTARTIWRIRWGTYYWIIPDPWLEEGTNPTHLPPLHGWGGWLPVIQWHHMIESKRIRAPMYVLHPWGLRVRVQRLAKFFTLYLMHNFDWIPLVQAGRHSQWHRSVAVKAFLFFNAFYLSDYLCRLDYKWYNGW